VTFDDAYASVRAALPVLARLGVPATIFVCAALASDGHPPAIAELADEVRRQPDELATLTWDELRSVVGDGVRVESHTLTHPHLPRLDDEALQHELGAAREQIERALDTACLYLAYPYGEFDRRVATVARGVGYRGAFALHGVLSGADAFALPRVGVWRRDGSRRFAVKTAPAVRRLLSRHPGLAVPFRSPKQRPTAQSADASPLTRI
jgi:peptidoglycan/xylan/chitin deacetylase (PgdA/CDA1 family)